MASSSEKKRVQFIQQRLETLLAEKTALCEKIDQHVKMVEERTMMWMKNPGSSLESYMNISSLLEIAVDSLLQKSDCFSDKDVVLLAAQFNASVKTKGSDKAGTSIINRLEQLEANMLVHQDTKQTIQDPKRKMTSSTDEAHTIPLRLQEEMKKVSNEQNLKIEKLTKQLQEQSQSIKAMDNEIKCLKEREYNLNKTVEKLSQDVQECKTNSDKINKEMQVQTDKTVRIIEEIKKHSGLIFAFQRDGNKLAVHTESQFQKLLFKAS
ncbi:uncharacterized protein LOC131946086 [Physella acuta]|uniref:uncharacterized protein LOC131946086 n=1 Tax=Physella acuta TaxID=109671 RepID=UPI0027DAF6B3|nr:uncharacterized protein LOC131946086 [Physella acuta]